MAIIMGGMILAGILAFNLLPEGVSFSDSVNIAGELGKFNLINLEFNLEDRYNIWSGLIAGGVLQLSYFGTDQSQVARYLGGASATESRLGLMFNGLLKIPMQFLILFIGVLVYVFYLFNQPPVFHNQVLTERAKRTEQGVILQSLEQEYNALYSEKRNAVDQLVNAIHDDDDKAIETSKNRILDIGDDETKLRDSVRVTIANAIPNAKTQDRDYIFLNFVLNKSTLPGYLLNGLLIC